MHSIDDGSIYGIMTAEYPQGEVRCHRENYPHRSSSPRPPAFLTLWKTERNFGDGGQRSSVTFVWQPVDDRDCHLLAPLSDFLILDGRKGAELLARVPRSHRLEVMENRQYQMALKMEKGSKVAILLKSLKDIRAVGDPLAELKIGTVDHIEAGMIHVKLVTNRASVSTPYPLHKIREDPMHPLLPPPKELRNFLDDPSFCKEHQLKQNDRLVYFEGDNHLIHGTLLWAGQLPPSKKIEVLIATDIFMGYPHLNFYNYYRLMKVNPDYVLRIPMEEAMKESALEDGTEDYMLAPTQNNNLQTIVKNIEAPSRPLFSNHTPTEPELELGSLVIGPDVAGVLKWKGWSQRERQWYAGVETDQFQESFCRGEFEGETRFKADAGFARFVPLALLRLDTRFLDSAAQERPPVGYPLNVPNRGVGVVPAEMLPRKPPIDSSEDEESSDEEVNDTYYRQSAPVLSPHRVTVDPALSLYRSCKVSPEHFQSVINNVEKNSRSSYPKPSQPSPVLNSSRELERKAVAQKPRERERTSRVSEVPRSPPLNCNSHNPALDTPPAVPARPGHLGFAVAPPADVNSNRDLRAGETVQLLAEPHVRGQVRWFGEHRGHRIPIIGIELFRPHAKANAGMFEGQQRFHTQPHHALFMPLSEVVRLPAVDERHTFDRRDASPSPIAKERDCGLQATPDVAGDVRPIRERDYRRLVGRNRGIQGDWNSCYLDSVLFSLFSFSSAVDSVLYRCRDANDIEEFEKVQTCLKEGIVNPLRCQFHVRAAKVMELRKILGQLTLKKDMCYSQKDIEELFDILMEKTLKMEPLIRLSSGEKTNMYQIFLESKAGIPVVPETQTLLELSLACSNIKFLEEPSLLLMLMPRFSAEDQLFQMIIPSPEIELSNCVAGYPHKCCNCKNRADRECLDCLYDIDNVPSMESTFQCSECFKKLHEFDKTHTPRSYTVSEEFKRMHRPQPMRLLLIAVICIRHSHYVSFVRAGEKASSPWVFFDSMFERKEGSHYTPCVREVNVNAWVEAAQKAVEVDRLTADFNLTSSVDASEVDYAERLFHDAYMCVYQSPNSSIYK